MMRIYRTKSISLLLLIAFCIGLLSGCDDNSGMPKAETCMPSSTVEKAFPHIMVAEETTSPTPKVTNILTLKLDNEALTYTTERTIFKDKNNKYASYSLTRDMEVCTVGQRMYYFESVISDADRLERIRMTEELFAHLGIDPEIKIYFHIMLNKQSYIEGNNIYVHFASVRGSDYISAVLLGTYGEFCNYGMVTGYARLLSNEAPEAVNQLPADWAYYDLNYLCFQPAYSGTDEVMLCKKLSLAFAADYVAKNGEEAYLELMRKSGQLEEAEEARAALAAYYAEHNAAPYLSPILYAMGGPNYDYLVKTEYACIYMDVEWSDPGPGIEGLSYLPKSFLHENYTEVKECFETLRMEMRHYQEHFDAYPYRNDLKVFFVKRKAPVQGGVYDEKTHQVYLKQLAEYSHEYIHALTYDKLEKPIVNWQAEGLTTYYESMFSKYFCELEITLNNMAQDQGNPWQEELYHELGHHYNPATVSDRMYALSKNVYENDDYRVLEYSPTNTYFRYGSFLDYLIRKFGEREVLDYLLINYDLATLTDHTINELVAAWKEENEMRFARIAKNAE